MKPLDLIRERLNNATPGPWFLDADGDSGVYTEARPSMTSGDVASAFRREDEAFIAHAPTDMARLLAALDGVLGLHRPNGPYYPAGLMSEEYCKRCRKPWPCMTVTAITAALEGGTDGD